MNRCKRWLALLLGAVLLLGTMSGCSGTTASDSEDGAYRKINLSMAVNGTDTQIDSLVAHHFADLVAERSGGSITIDVFPNDTLAGGNSTKGVEYIAVGAADLGAYATCVLANIEPKMSVATLPWSFTSYHHRRCLLHRAAGCKGHHVSGFLPQRLPPAHQQQASGHHTGGSEGSEDPCPRLGGIYGRIQGAGRQSHGHELERGVHRHPAKDY